MCVWERATDVLFCFPQPHARAQQSALACVCLSVGSARQQMCIFLQRLPSAQRQLRAQQRLGPSGQAAAFSSRPWKAIRAQPSPLDLPLPLITEISSGRSTGKDCLGWAAAQHVPALTQGRGRRPAQLATIIVSPYGMGQGDTTSGKMLQRHTFTTR